jgi:hypothetical protein
MGVDDQNMRSKTAACRAPSASTPDQATGRARSAPYTPTL